MTKWIIKTKELISAHIIQEGFSLLELRLVLNKCIHVAANPQCAAV